MSETTSPLGRGDRAPEITLPSATEEGTISLGAYRGRQAVLFALFRGLY